MVKRQKNKANTSTPVASTRTSITASSKAASTSGSIVGTASDIIATADHHQDEEYEPLPPPPPIGEKSKSKQKPPNTPTPKTPKMETFTDIKTIQGLINKQVRIKTNTDGETITGILQSIRIDEPFHWLLLSPAAINAKTVTTLEVNLEDVTTIQEHNHHPEEVALPMSDESEESSAPLDSHKEDDDSDKEMGQKCDCIGLCTNNSLCRCCDCLSKGDDRSCGCCSCLREEENALCCCCICIAREESSRNKREGACKNVSIIPDITCESSNLIEDDENEDDVDGLSDQIEDMDITNQSFRDLVAANIKRSQTTDNLDKSVLETYKKSPKIARSFVKHMQKGLKKECQEAQKDRRAPDIWSVVIKAANKCELSPDEEILRTWNLPPNFDLFKINDLAALFRLIITEGSKRKAEAFSDMKLGIDDVKIFELAKKTWIKNAKTEIQSEMCASLLAHRPADYTKAVLKATEKSDIYFSEARIKAAIPELPADIDDNVIWDRIWMELATDTISQIPIDWNPEAKKAYNLKTYPKKGFILPKDPWSRTDDSLEMKKTPEIKNPETKKTSKPTVSSEIMLNADGTADKFYLQRKYMLSEQYRTKGDIGLIKWLQQHTHVMGYLQKYQLDLEYSSLIQPQTTEMIEHWQDAYNKDIAPITSFEKWYQQTGHKLPGPAQKSPPPSKQHRQEAKDKIAEILAIDDGPEQLKSTKIYNSWDKLAQRLQNAADFMDSLNDRTREAIFKTFKQWKTSYPREEFKEVALRVHSSLLAEHILSNPDETGSMISFLQLRTPPESEQDWSSLFTSQCVQLPPPDDWVQCEEMAIAANFNNVYNVNILKSIKPEDFGPKGRFRSVYIGRQCIIPDEVFKIMRIQQVENIELNKIIWRRMYVARMEAAKMFTSINVTPLKSIQSPWINLLKDPKVTKTFEWDHLDILQYEWAHRDISYTKLQLESFGSVYNTFIRPLERLFTLNMPMNEKLLSALHSKDATDDLGTFILRLIGWTHWPTTCNNKRIVEELSRIRALHPDQLLRRRPDDPATLIQGRVECAPTRRSNYRDYSLREELRRQGVNIRKIFQSESKEELDDKITEAFESWKSLSDDIGQQVEQLRQLKIKKGYSIDADVIEKYAANEKKLAHQMNDARTTVVKLWKDIRSMNARRAAQRYQDIPMSEKKLQDIENRSTESIIKEFQAERLAHKQIYAELKEAKATFTDALKEHNDIFMKENIAHRMDAFEKVKKTELHIRDVMHHMEHLHNILQARGIPVEQYEPERYGTRQNLLKRESSPHLRPDHSPSKQMTPSSSGTSTSPQCPTSSTVASKPNSPELSTTVYVNSRPSSRLSSKTEPGCRSSWAEEMMTDWVPEGATKSRRASGADQKTTNNPDQDSSMTSVHPSNRNWMAKGTWAESHKYFKFSEKPFQWNGQHGPRAPGWGYHAHSIEFIHRTESFVGILDLKHTWDDWLRKVFPMNTFARFYTAHLDIEFNNKKEAEFINISTRHRTKTDKDRQIFFSKVQIPFKMAGRLQEVATQIEEAKLQPWVNDNKPMTHLSLVIPSGNDECVVKIETEQHEHWERMVSIVYLQKSRVHPLTRTKVQVPWIHWPRFYWYLRKLIVETNVDEAKRSPQDKYTKFFNFETDY